MESTANMVMQPVIQATDDLPRSGGSAARLSLGAAACALLVAGGSIGSWATVTMTVGKVSQQLGTVQGTTGDGQVTVALGLVAAVAMLLRARWPARGRALAWATPVLFVVAALIGGYDWWHIRRVATIPFLPPLYYAVHVGWGLVLVTLGAIAGGGLALAAAVKRVGRRGAASTTPSLGPDAFLLR